MPASNLGQRYLIVLMTTLVPFLSACQERVFVPDGDSAAGREVFAKFECHSCHRIMGEDFPAPIADPPVPVVLGNPADRKTRNYLFESIISPSHKFAKPRMLVFRDPPIPPERPEFQNIREGNRSRMLDYSEVMMVRELLDLVAYLRSRQD